MFVHVFQVQSKIYSIFYSMFEAVNSFEYKDCYLAFGFRNNCFFVDIIFCFYLRHEGLLWNDLIITSNCFGWSVCKKLNIAIHWLYNVHFQFHVLKTRFKIIPIIRNEDLMCSEFRFHIDWSLQFVVFLWLWCRLVTYIDWLVWMERESNNRSLLQWCTLYMY